MILRKLSLLSALVVCLASAIPLWADGFEYSGGKYTVFDVPGATDTGASGINNLGEIVGSYVSGSSSSFGFLYVGGSFTSISALTFVSGINDRGQIVGDSCASGICNGYLDNGGTLTPISVPGAGSTFVSGINNAGEIVGFSCGNPCKGLSGFSYDAGVYTPINFPGAINTAPLGISNSGQIVGDLFLGGLGGPAFVYNQGVFTTFNLPGAIETEFTGINVSGQIVGNAFYSSGAQAFEDNGGTFTTINVPTGSQTTTTVGGINDSGQIVGSFVVTPEPCTLSLLCAGLLSLGILARRRSGASSI